MSAYSTAVIADSPLKYWQMEDASGNAVENSGGTAITVSNVTYQQSGPVVGGLGLMGFNGTSSFGQVPLDLSALTTFTIEFILHWNTNGSDDDFALEHSANANSNSGFNFDWNNSSGGLEANSVSLKVNWGIGTGRWYFPRPTDGNPHHIAAVISAGNIPIPVVYIDGVAVTVSQGDVPSGNTGTLPNTTLNLMSRNGSALFGAGRMGHLAFYPGALSAGQISTHYTAMTGGVTPKSPPFASRTSRNTLLRM